jgi:hypothetical protein
VSKDHQNVGSFNPDAATVDQEGWAPGTGFTVSPDAATVDEGPVGQAPAPAFRPAVSYTPGKTPVSFNPDAPTSDSEAGASPAAPFKRNAAFSPDAPTSASDEPVPAAAVTGTAAAPVKPNLPFKPMSGGKKSKPANTKPAQTAPAYSPPPAQIPDRPVQSYSSHSGYDHPVTSEKEQKYQPDHRSFTLKEMERLEDLRYDTEMQQYKQAMSKWKSRLWIPFAMVIGFVLLILLGGAFAGAVGVIFVIIAVAAAIAILFATGKMKWLFLPKKPQKQLPQRGTPELTSIYSVRLRLKSMNLPKPIEVVIRKEEQLIGCDKSHCIQPLEYKGISHRHCMIISKHQHGHTEYYIRDENSKNGTRLNERKLDPGVEYPLQIGDVITLAGRYQFRVLSDAY